MAMLAGWNSVRSPTSLSSGMAHARGRLRDRDQHVHGEALNVGVRKRTERRDDWHHRLFETVRRRAVGFVG
jgi:hypothetical protein